MNLLEKVKKKLLNKFNNKSFSSYEEALRFCEKKTKGAYESKILTEYRFRKTNNFLENKGNLLEAPSMPLLMFAVNYFLRKEKLIVPGIIDFGGACGESLILLEKIFDGHSDLLGIESLNYSISMPIFLTSQELILLIFSISIGIISCIIPAFNVYKMNISKTLTDE